MHAKIIQKQERFKNEADFAYVSRRQRKVTKIKFS